VLKKLKITLKCNELRRSDETGGETEQGFRPIVFGAENETKLLNFSERYKDDNKINPLRGGRGYNECRVFIGEF
jgi:hypothetical protein